MLTILPRKDRRRRREKVRENLGLQERDDKDRWVIDEKGLRLEKKCGGPARLVATANLTVTAARIG